MVKLKTPPSPPFFYYRLDDGMSAVIVTYDDLKPALERMEVYGGQSDLKKKLKSSLEKTVPLQANSDLYAYVFEDSGFWSLTRSLVIDLIETGKVAIVDPGGQGVSDVYVEHRGEGGDFTFVRIGEDPNSPQLIWQVRCIL